MALVTSSNDNSLTVIVLNEPEIFALINLIDDAEFCNTLSPQLVELRDALL